MPQTIDVTGLPESVVNDLVRLVNTLRGRAGPIAASTESPKEWVDRLTTWAKSHPRRDVPIDDDRETIYGGRGE